MAGRCTAQDRWHPEYPLVDELDPLRSLAANPTPDPVFTMYMIRRASDGLPIGGFGFFGPPDDSGRVEIGYGLVPAARGAGLATEAVQAALQVAAEHGATAVAADTDNGNQASQRVLLKAGFVEVRRDQQATFFARPLGSPFSPDRPVVYELDGSAINNLDDLYRLLGEAVNGPGGYFGANLDSSPLWGLTRLSGNSSGDWRSATLPTAGRSRASWNWPVDMRDRWFSTGSRRPSGSTR